jgi:signal peptidase
MDEELRRVGRAAAAATVAAVVLLALLLLALGAATSWPPHVVTGDSMAPNLVRGDLVFVEPLDAERSAEVRERVVTVVEGERRGYERFGGYGDVIVFRPNASWDRGPLLHRAVRWIEAGETWQGGNTTYTASHAGYLTDADGHPVYDQRYRARDVVRPRWVSGVARYRLPWLGRLGLWLAEIV